MGWHKFRPEFIVTRATTMMFRVPSKEFKDFIEFQQQEVCALAKELGGHRPPTERRP